MFADLSSCLTNNFYITRILSFISNRADAFLTFFKSRIVHLSSCDLMSFTNFCALNVILIGQTARHLRHRIAEHAGVSHLTGNIMKSQFHSNIRDHCSQCIGSECSASHFKILARGSTDLELLIKERLLINRHKPQINGNIGSFEILLS